MTKKRKQYVIDGGMVDLDDAGYKWRIGEEIVINGKKVIITKLGVAALNRELSRMTPTAPAIPPGLGEALIVLFAPKNRVDAVVGDLTERFAEESAAKGQGRAKLLFWARVSRSIGPLLWIKIRNAGLFAFILELGRRLIGS
jgi:hypothetical protein